MKKQLEESERVNTGWLSNKTYLDYSVYVLAREREQGFEG